ncbi:MAG: hypothetical protein WCO04_09895 [Pseudomonadota bacterium]
MGVYDALALLIATRAGVTAYIRQDNCQGLQSPANVICQTALIGVMAVVTTVVRMGGNFDLPVASVLALRRCGRCL